jgi:hypothetical protein
VRIDGRFNGPPHSGHGGYVAGSLAVRLPGPGADVWLRSPAPLDAELREEYDGTHLSVWADDVLVAEADPVEVNVDPVPFVRLEQAQDAQERFAGAVPNRYETCFGCGRLRDDGLRIHPGAVSEGLVACVWLPRGRVAQEWVWAALDCTSGWAWPIGEVDLVTGRLTGGMLDTEPLDPVGPYIAVGAQISSHGRKHISAAALFTPAGHRVAGVRATWLLV